MFYNKIKWMSYLLLVTGILLLIYGLWQYMPRSFSSHTSDIVYMSITAKRIVFPIMGLVIAVIGYTFLRFIHDINEEQQLFRNELRRLNKLIEKNNEYNKI